MKLVLDSCVALKWVLPESDSAHAIQLRDDFGNGACELIAPDIFPVEIAHALTRSERRGVITRSEVAAKMAEVYLAAPILSSYLPLLERAVEFSAQFRIGVYDCLYLALAEREQCELVTADARLLNATRLRYVKLLGAGP